MMAIWKTKTAAEREEDWSASLIGGSIKSATRGKLGAVE